MRKKWWIGTKEAKKNIINITNNQESKSAILNRGYVKEKKLWNGHINLGMNEYIPGGLEID